VNLPNRRPMAARRRAVEAMAAHRLRTHFGGRQPERWRPSDFLPDPPDRPALLVLDLLQPLEHNEDGFAEILLSPASGVTSRTAFHDIRLNAASDLWYQGSGATEADRDVGFGYSGRPASGHHDLMRVIETSVSYDWNRWLTIRTYYGHLFGDSVVRSIFAGDQADFGFIEVTLRL
jgi:hypothetical protein